MCVCVCVQSNLLEACFSSFLSFFLSLSLLRIFFGLLTFEERNLSVFISVCVCFVLFLLSALEIFFSFFFFWFCFFSSSMEGWSIDCLSCFSRGRFYCRCRCCFEISGCLRWLWSAGHSPDSAIAFISWSVFRLIGALEQVWTTISFDETVCYFSDSHPPHVEMDRCSCACSVWRDLEIL